MRELSDLLYFSAGSAEAFEHFSDVGPILHGDDTKFVLFVYPDQESFIHIVIDPASIRPVIIQSARFKEAVTLFEQEMIVDKSLLYFGSHSSQWVVFTSKVTSKALKGFHDFCFNFLTLSSGLSSS